MGELSNLQRAFTEHLRDPAHNPVPEGLDERRMGIYAGLVFNNLASLLSNFFPVLKQVITKDQWQQMVRDFFISHQSQTPYFPQIAGEFVEYLGSAQLAEGLPGFTAELAHYEWLELALFTLDESPPAKALDEDRLADLPLSLSPLAMPLAYTYPVHRISADLVPTEPDETPHCLLMLRDQSESIRFFELQPLAYQLLSDIRDRPGLVPRQWLEDLAIKAGAGKAAAGEAAAGKAGAGEAFGNEAPADFVNNFINNGVELLKSLNQHLIFTETQGASDDRTS
ncbi:MAG: HvfC family RiPP maturation protein [Pseudomonadales bacterium]